MSHSDADLLNVAPNAPLADLKKAFRKAALVHHPDHNPDPSAARHFRRLTDAYKALEAQALLREPPKPRREIPLADRVGFLVGDIRALVKKWPGSRWTQVVDGLPAAVWVASILEVLEKLWFGPEESGPVRPDLEGIVRSLDRWPDRMAKFPLPHPVPKDLRRALNDGLAAADVRLKAMDRPRRTRCS